MIDLQIDREGEGFVFENDWDTIIPVSYFQLDGRPPTVTVFPSAAQYVREVLARHEDDLFSDEALAELWQSLASYMREHGYSDDRFRDRWGHVLRTDGSSLHLHRVQPSTRLLTASDEDMNITTFDIEMSCDGGLLGYGTETDRHIVSLAMTHDELPDSPSLIEVGVETAPDYRGRGYAVSNLAALCEKLTSLGHTAEYRCQRYNAASLATALGAGLTQVGRYYFYVGRQDG